MINPIDIDMILYFYSVKLAKLKGIFLFCSFIIKHLKGTYLLLIVKLVFELEIKEMLAQNGGLYNSCDFYNSFQGLLSFRE